MSEWTHRCMGCMYDKGESKTCKECGWVEGTMPESPQHLVPGTMLQEKYLVGRVLGQGGFGITYLGWDIHLDMKLAIKEYMPRDFATRNSGDKEVTFFTGNVKTHFENGMKKFLDEAKILAKYSNHPGIVSVRDFFKENGTAYLVMYYLDGVDLKNYLNQFGGKLSYEQALAIMNPVMGALAAVHEDDILHRDISPDNIYITMEGEVKLLDFGAARHAMGDMNKSLSVILKPGYAPEEQYRSRGKQGPWTDIYGLAATFYRIITGKIPPDSLDRLEEETLIPPSQLGVQIPPHAEQALLKALSIKAHDRFQSMTAFQQALINNQFYQQPSQTIAASNYQPSSNVQTVHQATNYHPSNVEVNQTPPKKKKKGFIIGVSVGIVVLLALISFGVYALMNKDDNVKGPTDDPKDPGQDQLDVDPTDDPEQPEDDGPVIDDTVKVTVPYMVNMTESEAVSALQTAGLTVGNITYAEDLLAQKGYVINQSINGNEEVGKNSPVDLVISNGVELPVDTNTLYSQEMNIVNQYWDEGAQLYNSGQQDAGLKKYLQAREMAKMLYEYNGNLDARFAEGIIARIVSSIKVKMDWNVYALEDADASVTILTDLYNQGFLTGDKIQALTDAYTAYAWSLLLAGYPEDSMSYSQEAIALEPTHYLAIVTLAHAYLLSDYFYDAFPLYAAVKDTEWNGQPMIELIAEDYGYLRNHELEHPDMAIIEDIVLGNSPDKSDEAEIERTLYFQMYAQLSEDVDSYMSTYMFDTNSQEYQDVYATYQNMFSTYDFTTAQLTNFVIDQLNGDEALATVSMYYEYNDGTSDYQEEVSYLMAFTRASGSLTWLISGVQPQ